MRAMATTWFRHKYVVITVPTIIMFTVELKLKLSVNIIVRPYVWTYGLVVTSLHFIQI